jgi:hypothetical protein
LPNWSKSKKRSKQLSTAAELPDTLPVKRMRIGNPGGKPFPKGHDPRRRSEGRPVGSLNKITRTMKDALVAAAVELGQLHTDQWAEHIKLPDPDGLKHYFKVAAVEEMKTFLILIGRIMPLHVQTSGSMPKYLSREQMIERLKEVGMPENAIDDMRPIDARLLDPEDLGFNPYDEDDPDDAAMQDITPKETK